MSDMNWDDMIEQGYGRIWRVTDEDRFPILWLEEGKYALAFRFLSDGLHWAVRRSPSDSIDTGELWPDENGMRHWEPAL
jgi:hypothetical protein